MRSILYAVTFVLFALAIVFWVLTFIGWLITDPGFEPLNVLAAALVSSLGGLLALLKARTAKDPPVLKYSPTPEQRERNRRAMLDMVRRFWVEGVLEQSLHNAAMIELSMEERPGAVEHPWDMVLQTDGEERTLPPGTKIADIFDEMGGNLLILGEPGSGKTTILLELARDTIACADQDPTQPIPVVFNLSSWAEKRQPIAEWLLNELNTKYNIPKKIAQLYVECDELLPLLDGLDEVALKFREDCVRAINEFRQDHLVPLVVCCRAADYEGLTTRLRLQGAVLLQPLTPQQIDEYLGGAGVALSAVRGTLQHDPTLQELAETPLMLSIMTLAYQDVSVENLQVLHTVEARRQHLFDTYVRRMFERRRADQLYSPRQTIHWLAWLAQKMSEHAQSVFLIERLQPCWLPARGQRWFRVFAGLFVGLMYGQVLGTTLSLVLGLFSGLDPRPLVVLCAGLIFGLGVELVLGLLGGLVLKLDAIEPVEALKWSWIRAMGGLVGGLVTGLIGGLGVGLVAGLRAGLGVGLLSGIFGVLIGVLTFGLGRADIETKRVPNQGIRRSAQNALVVGLVACLVLGLVLGAVVRLLPGAFDGLDTWLFSLLHVDLRSNLMLASGLALVGGLYLGLDSGGRAVILHLALRCFLWCSGYLPWNLVHFLDYAAERIFLRKVGGGYIFIHRLLQDHFASLYKGE